MQQTIVRRAGAGGDALASADLHPLLRRLYAARGVMDASQLDYGLASLARPEGFLGMETAASTLANAVMQGQRITIVGDFDADGATSTALAVLALTRFGAHQVDYRVPSRFTDGYGLTPGIIDQLAQEGSLPDLILTVDNGIAAHEGVARAGEKGVRVVVTDHHLPGETLPGAEAIVNPNQPGCGFPTGNTAGVTVTFYVMSALRRHLEAAGWFAQAPPAMAEYLDLVALGTVADVVPLDHNNRTLVAQGLRRIRAGRTRPGIRALLELAGRDADALEATDLGFVLGPRLNAAGRLDDMAVGIECLLTEDEGEAQRLASELDRLNRERRTIESDMRGEAESALARLHLDEGELPPVLCLHDEQWHEGVIGLLASRIRERFHRPVIAFARGGEGLLKGSARSVPGLHIRDLIAELDARHPGLLNRYGGHAMAAGMTLTDSGVDQFREAVTELVRERVEPELLRPEVLSDGELEPHWLTLETAHLLSSGGPWGQGFPEPVFDGEFELLEQRIVGERHLKLQIGVPGWNTPLDGIAFNIDTDQWPCECRRARLAYQLDANRFRGRERLQLRVLHLEPL
ncbi:MULTISPECIES: single-stranded-DNA-specific exonuclease RecJ [Halomonadaceae]|uniref:Single-stranded-DNA-specific exonuclease RecJ n=1 Tax=Vreelandella halophila TaxID=86177 RepID=A0A9X4YBH3_9GAMM|nr:MULTISPECIES: single-stranded-DNA-specific exonuclease RecJ [Halomonas]MYL26431.1 single-stranded-DNA-specific exonuclease RecJ [Halomonas utahensis]MYL73768.1 single-stranded-DNA-specific exonuclease RecJ [Halomonas sp. 22501_18_FS]